jgi:antitoxin YefM
MTRFLTISEARKQLLEMPDTLQDEPVVITRHGKPVMAAMSYEQFESVFETLELLGDSALMADLRESTVQAERGERVSLAEVRARLER